MRAGVAIVLLIVLAGCKREPEAPALALQPVPAQQRLPASAPEPGRVSIRGDDALADVLSWTLPEADIDQPARARSEVDGRRKGKAVEAHGGRTV